MELVRLVMSKFIYKLIAFVCLVCNASVHAAAELVWDGSQYTGATGIEVGGALYDVSFVDGTCASIFNGCDEASDFQFDEQGALEASQAFLGAFFHYGFPTSGPNLDLYADFARGCSDPDGCVFATPFSSDGFFVDLYYVANGSLEYDYADSVSYRPFDWGVERQMGIGRVWAVWSPQIVAVPIPPSAGLFGLSLAILLRQRQRISEK